MMLCFESRNWGLPKAGGHGGADSLNAPREGYGIDTALHS